MKKSRKVFWAVLLVVILLQLSNSVFNAVDDRKRNIEENNALNQLMSQLQRDNIHHVYSTPGIVPIINFVAKEAIIGEYFDKASQAFKEIKAQPALVLPLREAKKIIKNLKYVCKDYKEIKNNQYALFYFFKKPEREQIEVFPYNWDAESNYNNEEAKMAFDRDAGTRWTTHMRQIPDMYYQLDLKKETLIDRIVFYLGKDVSDRPSGLEIKVSNDNKNWKRIVYLKDNRNILFWSGPYLLWKNYADRQEYYFKPVRARYIRFNQLGYIDDSYWSITELFVYGPSFKKPEANYSELDSYLEQKKFSDIYSDYWINKSGEVSKNIKLSSGSAIITASSISSENVLRENGVDYKKDIVGCFFVYYSLESKNPLVPLDKKDWVGSSNVQPNGAERAFDNDLMTRWSTDKVQSPGYYFQIDLKEEKYISGLRLWHAGSPNDWPRDVKIEFLDSDSKWETLEYKKDFLDSLYWTGFNILVNSTQYNTYVFNTVKTKAVRCILKESNNKYYWSIHEIDLLTPCALAS